MSEAPADGSGQAPKTRALAVYTGAGLIVYQLASLLATILIARGLGPVRQGRFHLVVAIAAMAAVVCKSGLDEASAYLIPKYRVQQPKWVRPLITHTVLSALVISLIVGSAFFFGADLLKDILASHELAREIRYELGLLPALMLLLIGSAILRGLGRADLRALVYYFLVGVGFLIAVAIAYSAGMTPTNLYWVRILTFSTGALVSVVLALRIAGPSREPLPPHVRKQLWSFGRLMIFVSAFQYLLSQPLIDLFVVSHVADESSVGIYAVAQKLASPVVIALFALHIVVGPALAESIAKGRSKRTLELYQWSAVWVARLSLYAAGGIIVLGTEALSLFGPEYTAGLPILIALVLARLGTGCLGLNSALLLASGFVWLEFVLTSIALAIFLALVVGLGVLFGDVGVAVATGGAMLLLDGSRHIACRKKMGATLPNHLLKMLLACGLAMGSAILVKLTLDGFHVAWVLLIVGSAYSLAYVGISTLLGLKLTFSRPDPV